jgi:hypothetical protein
MTPVHTWNCALCGNYKWLSPRTSVSSYLDLLAKKISFTFSEYVIRSGCNNFTFLHNSDAIRRVYERCSVYSLLTKLTPSCIFKLCFFTSSQSTAYRHNYVSTIVYFFRNYRLKFSFMTMVVTCSKNNLMTNFIKLLILSEEDILWNSLLRNFLKSPVIFSPQSKYFATLSSLKVSA